MNPLKLFTACAALLASRQAASAQSITPSILNASGGSQTIAASTYEWSIGEMTLVNTATTGSIIVTQGLLQPVPSLPSVIRPVAMNDGEILVFPVPSTSVLNIKPAFKTPGTMVLVLADAVGRTVLQSSVALKAGNELQQLNISALANGNYMLNISYDAAGSVSRQSYKIQRIN